MLRKDRSFIISSVEYFTAPLFSPVKDSVTVHVFPLPVAPTDKQNTFKRFPEQTQ